LKSVVNLITYTLTIILNNFGRRAAMRRSRGIAITIAGAVALLIAASNNPSSAAEPSLFAPWPEPSLFDPWPTATGRFGEMFEPWIVLKDKDTDAYAGNRGSVALEDDDYTGAIFVTCIGEQPDFLIVVDRKKAVLNGGQAYVRIRVDGQPEKQFHGRAYGDRFVQVDDPSSAIALLANAQTFVVGLDVSGVHSALGFNATMRPLKTLANVMSQCKVPVSASGK
jgi:hypothetical protein